jgi:hypothetical protein
MPRTDAPVSKDPTKRVPRQEEIGRTKKKLDADSRRGLEMQVAQREEEIAAKKDLNPDADVSAMKREIDDKKMILQHDEDLEARGGQRDRMSARVKEIDGILVKNMPTKREMWPKAGSSEAQQAVRHNLKFQEQYDPLVHERMDLLNKLNPDDPGAASLELIRPD